MVNESIGSLIAWVKDKGFSLSLSTERLAFIFALNALQSTSDKELTERDVREAYRMVIEEFRVESEIDNSKFNNMIEALLAQRVMMLIRIGGDSEASYRLTPLGVNLSGVFAADHALSKEKINIQMSSVASKLSTLISDLNASNELEKKKINIELEHSILIDLANVDTIQRNMDEEQAEVRDRISSLFDLKWEEALDEISQMLVETAEKIKQVTEIISVHSDTIQSHILAISMILPETDEYLDCHTLLERVTKLLERICTWSEMSFKQWKLYDTNLLDNIKKLINVDGSRHISSRLLKQLKTQETMGLTVVNSDEIVNLSVSRHRPPPKVTVGVRREKIILKASEIPEPIGVKVKQWVRDNTDFNRDINVPLKVESAIEYFNDCEPLEIAQLVILELQSRKRPRNTLRKAVWTDVKNLGRIRSKILEVGN